MSWEHEQHWESDWWGKCLVTFWEETKQLEYAGLMGIPAIVKEGQYPFFQFNAKTILDIGGGPVSMLLKSDSPGEFTVIDPCDYPVWTMERYKDAGITFIKQKGEDMDTTKKYDLTLIYNVLQHTDNPELIIQNARKVSKEIRIFEWVNTAITPGHPHTFTKPQLDSWLGGEGKSGQINKNGCHGEFYAGIFRGNLYENI